MIACVYVRKSTEQNGVPDDQKSVATTSSRSNTEGRTKPMVEANGSNELSRGKVIKRTWRSRGPMGERVRRVAWGYTLMVGGARERRFAAEWQSEDDAYEALRRRRQEVAAGRIDRPADATLGVLADEYLRHKANEGKRSLRNDTAILKQRILPTFGAALPVRALTETAIARYEQARLAEVSAYTVANELGVLRHMLRLGRRWGYLERVPEIEMPKKPEGRRRFLDADEIARLLAASAESRNPYLAAIVTIAISTGMRKGEILGLAWERVDLATGRLTLYHTKSGKPRGVPMNRAVYDTLVALEPSAARRAGLLFKRSGDRAWGQIRTAFTGALKRAGIENFRFHDLRHTAASHMVMRGASLKDVQEVLGHSDFKMTMRYAHLSPAHLRAAVDRLDGLIPAAVPVGAEASARDRVAEGVS